MLLRSMQFDTLAGTTPECWIGLLAAVSIDVIGLSDTAALDATSRPLTAGETAGSSPHEWSAADFSLATSPSRRRSLASQAIGRRGGSSFVDPEAAATPRSR
jgi:hypothetical protein